MMCPGGFGGWGMAWMGLSSLLFLVLIVVGVILLVRYLNRPAGSTASPHGSAEHVLAERYARGDIDEQEYRQRLNVLRGGHPS